jgi:hypothetical protein
VDLPLGVQFHTSLTLPFSLCKLIRLDDTSGGTANWLSWRLEHALTIIGVLFFLQ